MWWYWVLVVVLTVLVVVGGSVRGVVGSFTACDAASCGAKRVLGAAADAHVSSVAVADAVVPSGPHARAPYPPALPHAWTPFRAGVPAPACRAEGYEKESDALLERVASEEVRGDMVPLPFPYMCCAVLTGGAQYWSAHVTPNQLAEQSSPSSACVLGLPACLPATAITTPACHTPRSLP